MFKKSFTMVELIFVIVIVSIISIVVAPKFCGDACGKNSDLVKAGNQVLSHIRYTRHLAMIDNKFQPYPLSSSSEEIDRSRYWFKQWWQIYFTKKNSSSCDGKLVKNSIYYQIFSDSSSYNRVLNGDLQELALSPVIGKYLVGNAEGNFPDCEEIEWNMNLTYQYSVDKVTLSDDSYRSWGMGDQGHEIRLLFDNVGRAYFGEGEANGGNDINPYNHDGNTIASNRLLLKEPIGIILYQGSDSISICIEPETGYSYISYDNSCS